MERSIVPWYAGRVSRSREICEMDTRVEYGNFYKINNRSPRRRSTASQAHTGREP